MISDHIKGCFLGLAVGDALGVPVEFRDRSFFKDHPVKEMLGYGTWNQKPGTWSDDSSLTFCLAESLDGGYDLDDIAKKFVAWYKSGYWGAHHKVFDIGGATRFSLDRIIDGESPTVSGEIDESSNGNGSLMRIIPASLYFSSLPDAELYNRIKEVSSITHAHFRSVFSCFLFSLVVRNILGGDEKEVAYQNAIKTAREFSSANNFNLSELQLFERILDGDLAKVKENDIYSSGYVLHTLEASLWCFLNTTNFSDAVLKAVNLGEDTDTTGCVTGGLAGLYYGVSAIPPYWLVQLAREKDITELAENFEGVLKK